MHYNYIIRLLISHHPPFPHYIDLNFCRRAVLRLWKEKQGLHATYENLLKVCYEAGVTSVAQAICDTLKHRGKGCGKFHNVTYTIFSPN